MEMDLVYRCCAGLDVHKETVAACALWVDAGGKSRKEVRTFGTTTRDLLALSDWLGQKAVTHVAMESTGVFWKPVFNILEGHFEVLLVNPRDIKQVPGRKTDVKDSEWIAQLLQHGLLRASFVPDRPQRELRDLTRHRAQLVAEQGRIANRIHKTLEDANIKLGSVASDILGASGRQMIQAILAGQDDSGCLAELAVGRLRSKIPQLSAALEGHVTEHHRFMLRTLWDHLTYLEGATATLDQRIEEKMRPFERELELLATLPGVKGHVSQALLAEIGTDMSQFPTDLHISSWSGLCPGNHESAGKRKSGKAPKANRWLRRCLSQGAWAASHTKNTYLSSQFRRLAGRRGKKRAIIALAHTMLVIAYHVLKERKPYHELGANHFDRLQPDRLKRSLVRRLETLGYSVTLTPSANAA
jgi:transposase